MRSDYTFVRRLGDNLVVLEHYARGHQIWDICQTRKGHNCAGCGTWYAKGSRMFRPVTNADNRYRRICPRCMCAIAEVEG